MNILGVIAAVIIAAGASASAAAAPHAGGGQGRTFTAAFAGSAVGADLGMFREKDRIADLNSLAAVQDHAREAWVIGGGVPGSNVQRRQFACIRVGHRLQC